MMPRTIYGVTRERLEYLCRTYRMPHRTALMGELQNWQCPLCHRRMSPAAWEGLDRDHLRPRSRGGAKLSAKTNLRLVHRKCNHEKGAMTLAGYQAWRGSGMSKRDWREVQRKRAHKSPPARLA